MCLTEVDEYEHSGRDECLSECIYFVVGADSHPCFKCKAASTATNVTRRCSVSDCGRYYHADCVDNDVCPLHSCAMCRACHSPDNTDAKSCK